MKTLELDLNKQYSYADYLTWWDDERRELHEGYIKPLPHSHYTLHQEIVGRLMVAFRYFCKHKNIKFYSAPFDVRLTKSENKSDENIFTVVQPDFSFFIDNSKLDERGAIGSPDLIIEILNEGFEKRDIREKFYLYQKFEIKEYWIVLPKDEIIFVFVLDENAKYKLIGMFAEDDKIPVNVFNGELLIDLTEIFTD